MKKLTQKQLNFCRLYVELGNASEAYRQSYNTKAHYSVVNVIACNMLTREQISMKIEELRKEARERTMITVESLIVELEEARQAALGATNPQSGAAVAATMGKAKLCGLDKQIIEHIGDIPVGRVTVEVVSARPENNSN